jgi:ABC-type Co2+ transport system permease subunit
VFSNRLLLGGIAFELAFAFTLIYAAPFHHLFGTASLSPNQLLTVAPYPFIVWGADELRRAAQRYRSLRRSTVTRDSQRVASEHL